MHTPTDSYGFGSPERLVFWGIFLLCKGCLRLRKLKCIVAAVTRKSMRFLDPETFLKIHWCVWELRLIQEAQPGEQWLRV